MTAMLIPIATFALAVFAVFAAMMLWAQARARERQEDILVRLRAGGEADFGRFDSAGEPRIRNPLLRWACFLVWRTGADTEPAMVSRWLIAFALLVPVALVLFGVLAGLVTIAIVLAVSYALLSRQAAKRRSRIIAQLPDFLDSVARVLSSGNSLEESLIAAAQEAPDPIRGLFASIGRQIRLGAPVDGVLNDMAEVHKIRDLRVMALAANINKQYGGTLRDIFRSLISAIRSREMAARELRALTAETRFSAWVLAIIPIGIMLYILAMNPEYYTDMWVDKSGRMLLLASAGLQVTGVYVLWKMLSSVQDGDA